MNWYRKAQVGVINEVDTKETVRQHTDYTCGPATIQNLFRLLNRRIPDQEKLSLALGTNSADGTDYLQMEKALKLMNIPFRKLRPDDVVEDLILKGNAIVALHQDYRDTFSDREVENLEASHYTMIAGADNRYYHLIDSYADHEGWQSEKRKTNKEDFEQRWIAHDPERGIVLKRWGLVIPIEQVKHHPD